MNRNFTPDDANIELSAFLGSLPSSLLSADGERALPQRFIIDAPDGRKLKVRAYPNEAWAVRQEQILHQIAEKIRTPELLGRIDRYLVFEYLEVQQITEDRGMEFYSRLGKILSDLASYLYPPTAAEELDIELHNWLKDLRQAGFISAWGEETLWQEYLRLRPEHPRVTLGYWDAMPHNFGTVEDELVLLDEKHLQPSFDGVGLVKPSLLLRPEEFARVLDGYRDAASSEFVDAHRRFLKLYYLLGALHDYLLRRRDGVKGIPGNARLRSYRWQAFRLSTTGLSPSIRESTRFNLRFPMDSLRFVALKLVHPMTWRKLLRLDHPVHAIWDQDAI